MTDLRDLIPDDLHMTTAERLLLVAEIIDKHPERHDQRSFFGGCDARDERKMLGAGRVDECGTTYCAAGWATALTPLDEVALDHIVRISSNTADLEWGEIGQSSLGLEDDLAIFVFYYTSNEGRGGLVALLRRLAEIPEGERTIERCVTEGLLVRPRAHDDEVTFP